MTYRLPDGTGICVGRHRHEPERPRKAMPSLHLCGGCFARLDHLLAGLPDLADDLERALLPGAVRRDGKVSGSPTRPLGYNDEASVARRALLGVLESWTRIVAEEREERLPSDLSPAGQAEWHRYRLGVWTAAQNWIDEYLTNIGDAMAEGRKVLAGARSRTLTLGPCKGADRCDVETQQEVACQGKVRARLDLVDDLLPAAVACTDCGQVHTTRELPALGKAMTGGRVWLTTAQAAQMLKLSQRQTRNVGLGMAEEMPEGWRMRDDPGVRPYRWDADDVATYKTRRADRDTPGEILDPPA